MILHLLRCSLLKHTHTHTHKNEQQAQIENIFTRTCCGWENRFPLFQLRPEQFAPPTSLYKPPLPHVAARLCNSCISPRDERGRSGQVAGITVPGTAGQLIDLVSALPK